MTKLRTGTNVLVRRMRLRAQPVAITVDAGRDAGPDSGPLVEEIWLPAFLLDVTQPEIGLPVIRWPNKTLEILSDWNSLRKADKRSVSKT